MIESGVPTGTMLRLKALWVFCCALSVTPIVKLNVPAALGVPRSIPLAERLSPAGNEPATSDQLYGGVPPVAVRVWEYAVPTVPDGSAGLVVIDTGATTVRLNAFWVSGAAPLSVTRIVKLNEPSAEGVPLITPLDERFNPCGNEPEASDQLYGPVPPVAIKVWE